VILLSIIFLSGHNTVNQDFPNSLENFISESSNQTNIHKESKDDQTLRIYYLSNLDLIASDNIIYKFNLISGGIIRTTNPNIEYLSSSTQIIELTHSEMTLSMDRGNSSVILNQQVENQNANFLSVEAVWDQGYTGESAVVAVIDTGIDFNHPSLLNKKINEKNFVLTEFGYDSDETVDDLFGHGTSVASLISGNDPSFPQYRGMAYDSNLVNVKVANSKGVITSAGLIAAIDWAGSQPEIDVINISLGEPEESPASDLLELMASAAVKNGKVVVNSSGNNGKNGKNTLEPFTIGSPGSAAEVISVSGVDYNSQLASLTSEGPTTGWEMKPDFVAPGVNVKMARVSSDYASCTEGTCYRTLTGTSFSAPIISGVIALASSMMKTNNIPRNPGLIKAAAHMSARSLGFAWYLEGSGLLNATMLIDVIENHQIGLVLPSYNLHPAMRVLPAGESNRIPLTVVSDLNEHWQVVDITGNGTDFIQLNLEEVILGYTQIVPVTLNPINTTEPGMYEINIELKAPNGKNVEFQLIIQITPPVKYRMLLDLLHTPWDSIVGSGIKLRLERKDGYDIEDLIGILAENGIWVDEYFTGNLTKENLDRYDLIWMPSVFVDLVPNYLDRDPHRAQRLTNEELFALYDFKQRGGKFIIDFGGISINDNLYNSVNSDEASLTSLLSLFGLRISNQVSAPEIGIGEINPSFNTETNELRTTIGNIEINNGISIVNGSQSNAIVGYIGPNEDRAFIANNRNWRDKIRMLDLSAGGPNEFANEIIKWIMSSDGITYIDLYRESKKLFLSGSTGTNNIDSNTFEIIINKENEMIDISEITFGKDNSFLVELPNQGAGIFEIEIINGPYHFYATKEIGLQIPKIDLKIHQERGNNDQSVQQWDFIIFDDELIPIYNTLLSFSDIEISSEFTITVNSDGYSVTLDEAKIENLDTEIILEVIDSLGAYTVYTVHVSNHTKTPTNNSGKNKLILASFIVTSSVVLLFLSARKISKLKKNGQLAKR
jgi:hypothetical protein